MKTRMITSLCYLALITLFAASTSGVAAVKDDVLALTGGARAKMVWLKIASSPPINNYNTEQPVKIVGFDTDVGTETQLDAGASDSRAYPFITRSGQYVVWTNVLTHISYIQKIDGSTPKQVLLRSVPYYYAVSCSYDAGANKEYIYFCNKGGAPAASDNVYMEGTKLYKIELVNGAVDSTKKVLVHDLTKAYWLGVTRINESNRGRVFRAMPGVVSGDGRYFTANEPWSDIMVDDMIADTGKRISTTGCWPNIAPDNSKRLFYFNDAHTVLNMMQTFTSTQKTPLTVANSAKLSGLLTGGSGMDLCAPRWSNHPKFISVSNPLTQTTAVPNANFFIVKFNDTYSDITGLNVTTSFGGCNKVGDLWVASGEGPTKAGAIPDRPMKGAGPARISADVSFITVTSESSNPIQASLLDASGRSIAQKSLPAFGSWSLSSDIVRPGLYFIRTSSAGYAVQTKAVLCR